MGNFQKLEILGGAYKRTFETSSTLFRNKRFALNEMFQRNALGEMLQNLLYFMH